MKRLTLAITMILALLSVGALAAQTYPAPEAESTNKPVDVDVDTGANAEGAVDVDVSTTPDADTDASGVNETGTADDSDALPATAGELPALALIGLLALGGAFALRAKRA